MKCDICGGEFKYDKSNLNTIVIASEKPDGRKSYDSYNRHYTCCIDCMSKFMEFLYRNQMDGDC
jgi:hypothetical protein